MNKLVRERERELEELKVYTTNLFTHMLYIEKIRVKGRGRV